jgi:UDP-GlcNAc:undecaprenyl-phosphate GlcNAc-1-phosphate transferase
LACSIINDEANAVYNPASCRKKFTMQTIGLSILIFFIISFILSLAAVGFVLWLSHKNLWYDHINERKIHNGDIPRLGGIGFSTVFFLVAAVICFMPYESVSDLRYLPCLFALFLILILGVYDDFRPIASHYKLLGQFAAALIVISPGFIFRRIVYFDIGDLPVALSNIITFFWIVGLSNAINLIDGIDGLAGGLSGLIALFYGLIFYFNGASPQKVLFCAALAGVVAGFLIFNAPLPMAKIFMGDCGSQFLGFLLALLPLLTKDDSPSALPVPYAAALLMIPIFYTIAAVWRRIRDGRRIDFPDTSHVHHKLLNLGLRVRQVDAVLYSLQIILGVLVFISVRLKGLHSLYVLGAAYMIGISFFALIHFKNRAVMAKVKNCA